jgi:hypothetical protein
MHTQQPHYHHLFMVKYTYMTHLPAEIQCHTWLLPMRIASWESQAWCSCVGAITNFKGSHFARLRAATYQSASLRLPCVLHPAWAAAGRALLGTAAHAPLPLQGRQAPQ